MSAESLFRFGGIDGAETGVLPRKGHKVVQHEFGFLPGNYREAVVLIFVFE